MSDHFQLTTIVAGAIRECRLEAQNQHGGSQDESENAEEVICIAKAVLAAIAGAGYEISLKQQVS